MDGSRQAHLGAAVRPPASAVSSLTGPGGRSSWPVSVRFAPAPSARPRPRAGPEAHVAAGAARRAFRPGRSPCLWKGPSIRTDPLGGSDVPGLHGSRGRCFCVLPVSSVRPVWTWPSGSLVPFGGRAEVGALQPPAPGCPSLYQRLRDTRFRFLSLLPALSVFLSIPGPLKDTVLSDLSRLPRLLLAGALLLRSLFMESGTEARVRGGVAVPHAGGRTPSPRLHRGCALGKRRLPPVTSGVRAASAVSLASTSTPFVTSVGPAFRRGDRCHQQPRAHRTALSQADAPQICSGLKDTKAKSKRPPPR